MRCNSCGRENPSDVRFCIYCGASLSAPVSSGQAAEPMSATATGVVRTSELVATARPFGLVFITVWQFVNIGLAYAATGLISLFIVRLAEGVAAGVATEFGQTIPREVSEATALLSVLGVVLLVYGVAAITASIGLWRLWAWGRLASVVIQILNAALSVIMLLVQLFSELRAPGTVLMLLVGLVMSLYFVVYLSVRTAAKGSSGGCVRPVGVGSWAWGDFVGPAADLWETARRRRAGDELLFALWGAVS